LKPGNLFCVKRADGLLAVKVLDFGISMVTGPDGLDLAMTGARAIVGSPLYMSPEQMRSSHDVDARTDIWSLGVMLYELVTGRAPFRSEGLANLAVEITQGPVPSLREIRPDVPEGFERVVLRCMEKSRDDRYLNVGELAEALAEFAPARAAASVERVGRVVRTASLTSPSLLLPPRRLSGTPGVHSGTSASWRRSGRRTHPGVGGKIVNATIVAVMLVGGAAVASTMTSNRSPDVAGATPPWRSSSSIASLEPPPVTLAPLASESAQPSPIVAQQGASASSVRAAPRPRARTLPAPHVQWSPPVVPPPVSTEAPSPPPAPPPARGKPDCDPPYDIDSAGHRQYKPECL
jgi:serine/threonine-protein kinase